MALDNPILLVEDNVQAQKLFQLMFKRINAQLEIVSAVSDAVKILSATEVIMVIVDIFLPGRENGIDLINYIKQDNKLKHIPIIAISAGNVKMDVLPLLDMSRDLYYDKPLDMKSIIHRIRTVLNSS